MSKPLSWVTHAVTALAILLVLVSQLLDIFAGAPRWILGGFAVAMAIVEAIKAVADRRLERARRPKPPLHVPELEPDGQGRFLFAASAIPMLGYDDARAQLGDFIRHRGRFRWWMVTGGAGVGKSRLALELCKSLKGWDAGFVRQDADFAWDQWQPAWPTLLVFDYVASRVDEVAKVLLALSGRRKAFDYPVRVLLLERQADTWIGGLVGVGSEKYLVLETRHREAPLHLAGVRGTARWRIVQETLKRRGVSETPSEEFVREALDRMDSAGRPLFTMLFAEMSAAAQGGELADFEAVLRDNLDRDLRKAWTSLGATERDKNLLAFATMIGGLPVAELSRVVSDLLPGTDDRSAEGFNPARYQAMTGQELRDRLPALEPDIIGEFFVLEHLGQDPSGERVRVLPRLAREAAPVKFLEFAYRAQYDLGNHKVLDRIRPALDGDQTRELLASAGSAQSSAVTILAALHGARLGQLVVNGEAQAAWDTFGGLLKLAQCWPAARVNTVASAAASWLALAHLAADDGTGAIDVIEVLRGSVWPEAGKLAEPLEAFISALLLRAAEMTGHNQLDLADKLVKDAVATAQLQGVESRVGDLLAVGLTELIEAYTDKVEPDGGPALAKASEALKWIDELADNVPLTPEFAFQWGYAAGMVLEATLDAAGTFKRFRQQPYRDIAVAAHESGSKVLGTPEFRESVSPEAATNLQKRFDRFATVFAGT